MNRSRIGASDAPVLLALIFSVGLARAQPPATTTAHVSIRVIVADGVMSRARAQVVLARHQADLASCSAGPAHVALSFGLQHQRVVHSSIYREASTDYEIARCVEQRISRWPFPKAWRGESGLVLAVGFGPTRADAAREAGLARP